MWKMVVYLAVAGGVLDGVSFCAVLFPRHVLDEILDWIESDFSQYLET